MMTKHRDPTGRDPFGPFAAAIAAFWEIHPATVMARAYEAQGRGRDVTHRAAEDARRKENNQ